MLRSRKTRARGAARASRVPEPIVEPRGRHRPRARGAARRLGRARAARRARDADARRAARVRAARHVRRAVRRDRADRRALARRRRASSPAARAGASRASAPSPTPTSPRQREVVDAFLAAARDGDFDALVAVLDPDVVLRVGPRRRAALAGGCAAREAVAGAGADVLAARASSCARRSSTARPGRRDAARRRPFSVAGFTVRDGRIVAIDFLADPERLAQLDLTVLDG